MGVFSGLDSITCEGQTPFSCAGSPLSPARCSCHSSASVGLRAQHGLISHYGWQKRGRFARQHLQEGSGTARTAALTQIPTFSPQISDRGVTAQQIKAQRGTERGARHRETKATAARAQSRATVRREPPSSRQTAARRGPRGGAGGKSAAALRSAGGCAGRSARVSTHLWSQPAGCSGCLPSGKEDSFVKNVWNKQQQC